jgi:CPA2 family monovalent cation:H+ antiporter-2
MHNVDLILTLTGGLGAALVLGYVTQRLGLSPIVGYLLGGFVVGPNTPGFVANFEMANQLAEVGVILLMFGVGLQFHLDELLAVRRIAIPGAVGQSLVATLLGVWVALAFGWNTAAGMIFGLAISVASTVVLTRVLTDHNDLHTPTGHIAIGWLVVEDIFTVLVLVLLPAIFSANQTGSGNLPLALGLSIIKLGALIAFTFLVGGRVIPKLLGYVAATRSRELFTLTVLVVALGIAVGAAKLFGASMALGAFLAGMVVGRSDFSLRAASEALPMRDAFAVLFFVSVGMLFNPHHLLEAPGMVAATLAIILLGKPLAALSIVLMLGYPVKIALAVAVALAQIGEFSFILATLGKSLGALSNSAVNTIVAAAIVSITLNPLLYRFIDPLERWAMQRPRLWRWLNARSQSRLKSATASSQEIALKLDEQARAIIVGYGPVGKTVAHLLRDSEIEPTIIELNLETVRRLREEGLTAVYGDASHHETLKSAGIEIAGSLILSAAGMRATTEIIRLARELNPKIQVLARANYLHEIAALHQAGADHVLTGEGEVALAMTEFILRQLGATPEQIDHERDHIRVDLFDDKPAEIIATKQ